MATPTLEIILRLQDEATKKLLDASGNVKNMGATLREAGIVLAGIGATITGVAALSVKGAIDHEQAVNLLNQSLKNVGTSYGENKTAIESLLEAEMRLTNYDDEQMLGALNRLVTTTGQYKLSLEALPVVLDLAASKNMDLESAATIVGKALNGNTEMLGRYGIELTKGADSTRVLEELTAKFGGSAEAVVNPLTQLKNQTGELFEAMGALLLPALKAITDVLIAIIAPIKNFMDHAGKVGEVIATAVAVVGLLAGALGSVALILPKIIEGFAALSAISRLTAGTQGVGGLIGAFSGGAGLIPVIGLAIAAAGGLAIAMDELGKHMSHSKRDVEDLTRSMGGTQWAMEQATHVVADWGDETAQSTEQTRLMWDSLNTYFGTTKDGLPTVIKHKEITKELSEKIDDAWHSASYADSEFGKLGITYQDVIIAAQNSGIGIDDFKQRLADAGVQAGDTAGAIETLNLKVEQFPEYARAAAAEAEKLAEAQKKIDEETSKVNTAWMDIIKTVEGSRDTWEWQNSIIGKTGVSFQDLIDVYWETGGSAGALNAQIAQGNLTWGDTQSLLKLFPDLYDKWIAKTKEETDATVAATAALIAQRTVLSNVATWGQQAAEGEIPQYLSSLRGLVASMTMGGGVSGGVAPLENWLASLGDQWQGGIDYIAEHWADLFSISSAAGGTVLTPNWQDILGGFAGSFQSGGIVPGTIGMPQLAVVHGGEQIVPAGRNGTLVINLTGNTFLGNDAEARAFAEKIGTELQRMGRGGWSL